MLRLPPLARSPLLNEVLVTNRILSSRKESPRVATMPKAKADSERTLELVTRAPVGAHAAMEVATGEKDAKRNTNESLFLCNQWHRG